MQPTRLQTVAIADWDLALLPVSRRSESSRHPLAIKTRVTALTGNYHGPEVRFADIHTDVLSE